MIPNMSIRERLFESVYDDTLRVLPIRQTRTRKITARNQRHFKGAAAD